MNKPKIGVFSPSAPLGAMFPYRVMTTVTQFCQFGYEVTLGNLAYQSIGTYTTGSIMERAAEIHALIDGGNTVLMAMIGGWNCASILPFLDYEAIKKAGVKIIGLSDITAILLAVYKKTGLPTYYGANFLKSYAEDKPIQELAFADLQRVIAGEQHTVIRPTNWFSSQMLDWRQPNRSERIYEVGSWTWGHFQNKIITGRLIGGNLNTMVAMLGTPYFPEIQEGDLLFIEDSEKTLAQCERSFAIFRNSGIFDRIQALIVGRPEKIDQMGTSITYNELLQQFIPPELPVIFDFPCGHCFPAYLLKIGGTITIDGVHQEVILED